MERKILVAVDGSVFSTNSLRYLSRLFCGAPEVSVDLLYLVSGGPNSAGREWLDPVDLMSTISQSARKKLVAAKRYMLEAVHVLQKGGIGADQVTCEVNLCRMDTARDIIDKARSGIYDALVIGRRGLGVIEELVLGSISTAILHHCHDVPVWVIDGDVNSHRFLVPVDGTVPSLRAVDYLTHICQNNPRVEITLFHCHQTFRNRFASDPAEFYAIWDKDWCDRYLGDRQDFFRGPEELLLESGFPADRLQKVTCEAPIGPARKILRYAQVNDYGTIVIGRRGMGINDGIFNRVSDRILFMAIETAVWIIG